MKEITYVITLSVVFPSTHPRAGEPTFFPDKLHAAITGNEEYWNKPHTIRANYELWKKRFEKIEKGEACLSVRYWTGKPYCSKQVEIARLTKEDGIGLQSLVCNGYAWFYDTEDGTKFFTEVKGLENIAYNDGLSFEDWKEWFKNYDVSKKLAIIHFTKFRY